jgi:hypothetical protein
LSTRPARKSSACPIFEASCWFVGAIFDRQIEEVTDPALGSNDWCRFWAYFEYAPQPEDLNVNAPIEDMCVNSRCLQQMCTAESALRSINEDRQEGIFAPRQTDQSPIRRGQSPPTSVQSPAAKPALAGLHIALEGVMRAHSAPQDRANSGKKFAKTEGLGEMVVGAQFQSDDAIDLRAIRPAGDDHGNVGARSDLTEQVEAMNLVGLEIEQDQVWLDGGNLARGVVAILCLGGVQPIFLKVSGHDFSNDGIDIDDEDV